MGSPKPESDLPADIGLEHKEICPHTAVRRPSKTGIERVRLGKRSDSSKRGAVTSTRICMETHLQG